MDVNGSRFHFLNTATEWAGALQASGGGNLVWDEKRQAVTLQAENIRFPARKSETPLTPEQHRGAAYSPYGAVYWVGEDRRSLWFSPAHSVQGAAQVEVYWRLEDWRQQCDPTAQGNDGAFHAVQEVVADDATMLSGLMTTCDHYLLVGTHAPGGLLVFDLHAGGKPMWLLWSDEAGFHPLDICVAANGHIFILDNGIEDGMAGSRIWRLDSHFRVLGAPTAAEQPIPSQFFQPVTAQAGSGFKRCAPESGMTGDLAMQTGLNVALAIESLADGSLLVLETPADTAMPSLVHRFVDGVLRQSLPLESVTDADTDLLSAIRAHDFLFIADAPDTSPGASGVLYVCDESGNQSYAFGLVAGDDDFQLDLLPDFYPMHGYSGAALAANARKAYYAMQQRWLPLVMQPQRRFASAGSVDGIILDSEQTACVWHRIVLDACIPDDTGIHILTRTAEKREWLVNGDFSAEPEPYLRRYGSELAQQLPRCSSNAKDYNGSWELLLQNASGRYLEIRFEFLGNGRSTPQLRAMRVYYPRFSYLQEYLPAVYQDDALSAGFLDRYLANVEGLFTEMEERIAHIEYLFDARSSPGEFLQWLAGWLGVVFDSQWDDQRRRLFLRHVPLLYRWRGTLEGLRAMIAITISPCPDERLFSALKQAAGDAREPLTQRSPLTDAIRIVEHFQLRSFSALTLGGTDNQDVPQEQPPLQKWSPEQGVDSLHALYKAFLSATLDAAQFVALSAEDFLFPATVPGNEMLAQAWRGFLQQGLSFNYAEVDHCSATDTQRYREFLARRYGQYGKLNNAHGLSGAQAYSSFQAIFLPTALPAQGQALDDWLWFVSVIMPVKRNASRFTVLVPAYADEPVQARQHRLQKTQQLVLREKPAHTNFEVQLYWALFRAGSARLGMDSIVGEGSRYTAMVLDQDYLTQSYLAASHPFTIKDRLVTGRDRLQEV